MSLILNWFQGARWRALWLQVDTLTCQHVRVLPRCPWARHWIPLAAQGCRSLPWLRRALTSLQERIKERISQQGSIKYNICQAQQRWLSSMQRFTADSIKLFISPLRHLYRIGYLAENHPVKLLTGFLQRWNTSLSLRHSVRLEVISSLRTLFTLSSLCFQYL